MKRRNIIVLDGKAGSFVLRKGKYSLVSNYCTVLSGDIIVDDLPEDVYRRHNNCFCTTTYEKRSHAAGCMEQASMGSTGV